MALTPFFFFLLLYISAPDGQATSPEHTYADEGLVGVLDLTAVGDGYAVLVDHAPFVRIYQGEYRKTFALKGQGPGDLNDPTAISADGRRLFVLNRNPSKLVIYDFEGNMLESHRIRQYMLNYNLATVKGKILVESSQFPDLTKFVYALGSETQVLFSFPERPSTTLSHNGGMSLDVPLPFAPSPKWTLSKAGNMVIWDGVSKDLMIKDLSGETLGRMALVHKPSRISQADRQHWIDRTLPEGKTVFGRKDFYKGLRLAAKDLDFPSHRPLVQKLAAGEDGRIWVLKSNGAEGQRWIGLNTGEDPVELSLDKGRVARHFGKTSYAVVAITRDGDEMIEIYAYK